MRRRSWAVFALALFFIISLLADAGRTIRIERLLQHCRRRAGRCYYRWAPGVAPRQLNYAYAFARC